MSKFTFKRVRRAVLKHLLFWLPDAVYLKLLFILETGRRLNLKTPETFQEKIQWLKLYNRKPEYTAMVDKFAVKQFVADKIGQQYIVPTLGVWEHFDDIDFDKLPSQFVLKTTHGGGSGGVVICRDKQTFDRASAKQKLESSLSQDIYLMFREWPYKDVPRRIIAEQFLEIKGEEDLIDYKIFCFDGEPRYIQVIQNRHVDERIDFFSPTWVHQDFVGFANVTNADVVPPKPDNLDDMLSAARLLAKGTKFVRVDLYNIEGKVYFGELTFYPGSGLGNLRPEEWNERFGKMLELNSLPTGKSGGGKYLIYSNIGYVQEIREPYDYKFFCFNGEPKFLKVDFDRFTNHQANYYDLDFRLLPFGEADFMALSDKVFYKPPHFDKMVEIARKLSAGHKFMRVDLFNIFGKIYFGELTFYPASGIGDFSPTDWNRKIGDLLKL